MCIRDRNDGDVTENHGGGDVWILKITADGEIEWEQTYGSNSGEAAYSIIQNEAGNYLVAADAHSSLSLIHISEPTRPY